MAATAERIRDILAAKDDPYKVLGVARDCAQADIKKAFKRAVLIVHPDKAQGAENAADAFAAVEAAHTLLLDEEARARWEESQVEAQVQAGKRLRPR